jgi:hypothetical protein
MWCYRGHRKYKKTITKWKLYDKYFISIILNIFLIDKSKEYEQSTTVESDSLDIHLLLSTSRYFILFIIPWTLLWNTRITDVRRLELYVTCSASYTLRHRTRSLLHSHITPVLSLHYFKLLVFSSSRSVTTKLFLHYARRRCNLWLNSQYMFEVSHWYFTVFILGQIYSNFKTAK